MEHCHVPLWWKIYWCQVQWWNTWFGHHYCWWRSAKSKIIYSWLQFLMLQFASFDNYFNFVFADSQKWRLVCLALGFFLLLLAPIVSSWVPFYYSSSMAIGVFLVIIILLFQVLICVSQMYICAQLNDFLFFSFNSSFNLCLALTFSFTAWEAYGLKHKPGVSDHIQYITNTAQVNN